MTTAYSLFLPWVQVATIVSHLYVALADTDRAVVIDVHDFIWSLVRVNAILTRFLVLYQDLLPDMVLGFARLILLLIVP
jgi:hypothetical protein